MIHSLFFIVSLGLHNAARLLRISYNEINVVVWYFLIPFSWCGLLDAITGIHFLKSGFVIFTLGFAFGCRNFSAYSDRLFERSARFLLAFGRFGMGYMAASVLICVLLPLLIYFFLLYLLLL